MSKSTITPPILTYTQIKGAAESFLEKYHPDHSIPVPIEDIAELQLGLKLTAYKGLKKDFGIDGYLNVECDEIIIDDHVFNNYIERSKFTLAHEIGHKILHEEIYCKTPFHTVEEYTEFTNGITDEAYKWLEYQANVFAGCVLVPADVLKQEVEKRLEENSITAEDLPELTIPIFIDLPDKFEVSTETLLIRIQKEKLIKTP